MITVNLVSNFNYSNMNEWISVEAPPQWSVTVDDTMSANMSFGIIMISENKRFRYNGGTRFPYIT